MPRDAGSSVGAPDVAEGRTDPTDTTRSMGRRNALAAIGAVSIGATAGCLGDDGTVGGLPIVGDDRVPVEPEAPGDEPEATPGEFYYLLEDVGITVGELYFDESDRDLILFYESQAESNADADDELTVQDASDDEVALIYLAFRELVRHGADVNHLYTEVVNPAEGQVEGWGVNSEWAERHLEGEADDRTVWNHIVETMVYPEGAGRETDLEFGETDGPMDDENATGGDTERD